MLVTTTDQFLTAVINKTFDHIDFVNINDHVSQDTTTIEPVWASLSLITIILFTICGNSLVCIAVIRERHLQNTTNYFLTSLALTDCLVACLVMPLAVTVELTGHFPFNALACNVWSTFDVCCSTSSIWHMSVMSLDRYLTLRYPLKYGRNKRRSLMAYKIITIWLISFAICLPLFILGLVDPSNVYNEETRSCFPSNRTFKIYGSFVAFVIPFIIMIVTYALTMSALQQAHTTKKKCHSRRQKMHAMLNLATMAMRWKRVVNNDPTDEQKQSMHSIPVRSKQKVDSMSFMSIPLTYQRKRASSLLANEQYSSDNRHLSKRMFISHHRLNETLKPLAPITWYKRREKQLQPLPEKSYEQSSPLPNRHLDPDTSNNSGTYAKRSHSYTPLLNMETNRKDRRRSSSVHTLLQIRRDSAKISEELANLTAQLSVAMNPGNTFAKRASLSVPRPSTIDNREAPTIDQLLAQAVINQSITVSKSHFSVDLTTRSSNNQQEQSEHLENVDNRSSSFSSNDDKTTKGSGLPIPNLLVTHESVQNLPNNANSTISNNNNNNNNNNNSPLKSNLDTKHELMPRRLTSPSKLDSTCQRIKDWINITTSSTSIHHSPLSQQRCVSAINVTETTPMLATQTKYSTNAPLSDIRRHIPRIEQLYGPTSLPNSNGRPQQLLLVDDHVASVHSFASMQRNSICSITSSTMTARYMQAHRASLSSSVCSSFQQGVRKRPPRLNDGMSQASFQMVSLDTEDSSSGSSSLIHQSTNLHVSPAAVCNSSSPSSAKKNPTFRHLTKSSATNERKAMRVLLIIFSIFIILWTPFFVINLLSCFISNIHPAFISVATWLGFCSSGANPIIYTIFSRAFRRAFVNILTCRKVISSHRSQVFSPSCHSMTASAPRKMSSISKGQADLR